MTLRRHLPLRVALVVLIVALLVGTVVAIVLVGSASAARSVADLEERYFHAVAAATAGDVEDYLDPAASTLADMRSQIDDRRVRIEDGDDLGRYLAAKLRSLPTVAWLSFSEDEHGRFAGAWRRDDRAIVLNRSDPAVDAGTPVEHVVAPDGSLAPFQRALKGGYDPRKSEWYRRAAASSSLLWTEPFLFNEGRPGITSALAVKAKDGHVVGVLTADFFLDSLSRYLAAVGASDGAEIRLLSRAGGTVADSAQSKKVVEKTARAAVPVDAALESVPEPLSTLSRDAPITWHFSFEGAPHVAAARVFPTSDGNEWVAVVGIPEERFLSGVQGNRRLALLAAAGSLLVAAWLAWFLATRVSRPLRRIADDLARVARFELSESPAPATRIREVAVVGDAAERMKASLRSFRRYVPHELVRDLLERGEEARLSGRHRELSIFFADAEGFTAFSEKTEPTRLVAQLGEFLDAIASAVRGSQGTIDKFVGDCLVAFWNAPDDLPAHPAAACRAAIAARDAVAALVERWQAEGLAVLRVRIGLHVGEVVVGNIGTPERFAYTMIGDAVNLASRMESLNKRYGTRILASDAVRAQAGAGFEWREVDVVAVAGRGGRTVLCELLGICGAVAAATLAARDQYEDALRRYRARDFSGAADGFRAAGRARPDDRAAPLLAERCAALLAAPPPAEWDGADVLVEK